MALLARALIVFLHTFVWSLIGTFRVSYGSSSSDIECLKSIKESLEDPYDYLNSWNFNSNTEGFICKFTGVECWHADENLVFKLRLSGMELMGLFPHGFEKCESLARSDLSNNKLWGPLPFDIAEKLPLLTSLDLSSNSFSGEIPSSIADCSYLNILKLDNNQLMGHIPQQLGRLNLLKNFSVANNLLSGKVPEFVSATISPESYANNNGLCGPPLEPCNKHRLKFDYSFKSGFLIGYVVSLVSVITIFMSYCVAWVPVKKKTKIMMTPMTTALMERRNKKGKEADRLQHLQDWSNKEISVLEKFITRMSYTYLSNATRNFSQDNVMGLGKMGTMYKAALPVGLFFAVKRLHVSQSQHSKKRLMSELMTIGRLRHRNLLPLVGFCVEGKERLLVYKYMSNGNLNDWLQQSKVGAMTMEWPLRAKIAIGLARGLAWLHHSSNLQVIHLNISSKCILLDQNFEPKISNFGRAMFMNPNDTDLSKTFFTNSVLQESNLVKKDVLKFGIVLLELITGEDPIKNMYRLWTLAECIKHLSSSSAILNDAVDKSLIGQGFDVEIFHFLRIACDCVQFVPDQRPTMLEVYKMLKAVGKRNGLTNGYMQNEIVPADSGEE